MLMRTKLLSRALLPCLCSLLASQTDFQQREVELNKEIVRVRAELSQARAGGLRAIRVNGTELTPERFQREVVHLVGAQSVKAKIGEFFVREWKDRQIEEGVRKAGDFVISDEKIVAELQGQVDEFKKKNPGVEFWEAVRALTGMDKDAYMQQRRNTEMFNLVFFPGPANKWPMITREAIMASAAGGDGKEFWDNIEKSSVGEDGKPQELPVFWMHLCRGWVQKQLEKWSDIRYPSDGLSSDVVLSVNGMEWSTEAAFDLIRTGIFVQDLERAMLEVVIREALRQDLVKHGAYLSDEEFRKEFDDYRQEYDSTPFTTEVIATAFKGYPSLEAFRQRWRLMQSFEHMIAADINDDNLAAHGKRYARFFADGQTGVEMIQFMARSVGSGAWLPGGDNLAHQKSEQAWKELQGGADFDQLLNEKGEFYANDEEKGRLGLKSLNQLRQSFHESEWTDLLLGYSLGHHLFYHAEEGKAVGPLRGAEGWYIARVNTRTPATGGVNVKDERTRELVRQDYVTFRFMHWANDVLAKAKIE